MALLLRCLMLPPINDEVISILEPIPQVLETMIFFLATIKLYHLIGKLAHSFKIIYCQNFAIKRSR